MTRLHDSRSGTGDDHPVPIGDLASEVLGAFVRRLTRLDPSRTEDRAFGGVAVRAEHLEAVAELLHRGGHKLEITSIVVLAAEPQGRHDHLEDEFAVSLVNMAEQADDLGVKLVVASAVARAEFGHLRDRSRRRAPAVPGQPQAPATGIEIRPRRVGSRGRFEGSGRP